MALDVTGGAVRAVLHEPRYEMLSQSRLVDSIIELTHGMASHDAWAGLVAVINRYINLYETRQPGNDSLPAFSEDELMGFGKMKGKDLPANIKNLDYSKLHNSQVWVLADWMNVRSLVVKENSEEKRRIKLKEYCERNPERAQTGYEVVCLQKYSRGLGDTADDKKALELSCSALEGHEQRLDEKAELALRKHVNSLVDQLGPLAKKAVLDAAEKHRPFVVQENKSVRKIKGVLPPEFERMVALASQRIPILLVGPAGCGKTYLCERLAEALDIEYSDQSCSEGMSESVFNGLLLPTGKAGAFEHVTSPFMDRYENGGVMLLDEIDAGDPNLFTYINKAIANSSYSVPQRWTKPVVRKHKSFVLVAAANTFGHGSDAMYVGRNQLDAATLDRFKVGTIYMDYNTDVELSLANDELCDWAWKVRKKIRDNKLRRIMSTRVIKDLATMTEAYKWQQPDWEYAYFTGWSEADRRAVA
jgi:hypothetical protein